MSVDPWAGVGLLVGCGLWGALGVVLMLLGGCGRVGDEAPRDAAPGVSAGARMTPSTALGYNPSS